MPLGASWLTQLATSTLRIPAAGDHALRDADGPARVDDDPRGAAGVAHAGGHPVDDRPLAGDEVEAVTGDVHHHPPLDEELAAADEVDGPRAGPFQGRAGRALRLPG